MWLTKLVQPKSLTLQGKHRTLGCLLFFHMERCSYSTKPGGSYRALQDVLRKKEGTRNLSTECWHATSLSLHLYCCAHRCMTTKTATLTFSSLRAIIAQANQSTWLQAHKASIVVIVISHKAGVWRTLALLAVPGSRESERRLLEGWIIPDTMPDRGRWQLARWWKDCSITVSVATPLAGVDLPVVVRLWQAGFSVAL